MNTKCKFRLISVLFISILLVGGLLASLQVVRADSEIERVSSVPEAATAPKGLETTLATSLTVEVPDMMLALGTGETLDILSYTTYYSDSAALVFTATTASSDYFTATMAGTHYLNITSTSATTGGEFPVDIQVSDGVFSDTDVFTVTVASATPTLTISIPDMVIAPDGANKILDLWDYTTYHADKAALIYTVTHTYGENYVTATLMGGHYISMTSIYAYNERHADIQVDVSDGDLSDSTEFAVDLNHPPELDFFYGGLNELPDPAYVYAGQPSTLTIPSIDGEVAVPLEFYAYDEEDYDEDLTFSIANSPPVSLGIVISDSVEGHYVTFDPDPALVGTYHVEVEVQDTVGLTDTDMFTVTVLQRVFLPTVIRNYPPVPTMLPIDNPDGDAIYMLEWSVPGDGYYSYEVQYSKDDPTFSDPTTIHESDEYRYIHDLNHYELIKPGTYYWRVRVYSTDVEFPWSNVQPVSVGNFAYLYVEPLCLYGLRIEVWGSGGSFQQEYPSGEYCNDTVWWRSVPAGTYNTRLTWLGGSIVDNVPSTALGNDRYEIIAGNYPTSWQPY